MTVVLDTNVVVSGILKLHSPSGAILRLAAAGVIRLAYDARILSEYAEVLGRPVFGFPKVLIRDLIDQLQEEGLAVVGTPLPFRLPDPDDEPFLEVALAARAEALVTGNKRHFPQKGYKMRILSPAEFISGFGSEPR